MFAGAAALKLRDRRAFVTSLAGFGAPSAISPLLALIIPTFELATAALLLPAMLAEAGALVALSLLVLFSAAVAVNVARGRTPDCACFGAATSEPVGLPTIIRNVGFAAAAALVIGFGPGAEMNGVSAAWASSTREEQFLSALTIALLAVAALGQIYIGRLRSANARLQTLIDGLQRRAHTDAASLDIGAGGLAPGTPAPAFDLVCLEGDRATLTSLLSRSRPLLLVFSDALCPACHQLWPDVERWQRERSDSFTTAVVCSGSEQTIEIKVMGLEVHNVLFESDDKTAERFGLSLKPSAVFVSGQGAITGRSVAGVAAIRALVAAHVDA